MLEKMWASFGLSGVSFAASLSLATDILQFLTALVALASATFGFWLLVKNHRHKKP